MTMPIPHDIAARWGADAELEACCEWLRRNVKTFTAIAVDCLSWNKLVGMSQLAAHLEAQRRSDELRAARRPKPPSLKDQALARTDAILNDPNRALLIEVRETLELNRRALEALDD